MEIYYNLKPKNNSEVYGSVVKVILGNSKNSLELLVGDENILNKCGLASSGDLIVDKEYISSNITPEQAEKLKNLEHEWDSLRLWFY